MKKLKPIWKNLLFLNCTGINHYKYKKIFQQIVPKGILFQSYIGSEGLYGFQYDVNHPAMVLIPENAFYEFLDKVIKPLRVLYIQPGEFDRYILEKTKLSQWNLGQKKLPQITDSQDFLPFFRFKGEGLSNLI